MLVTSGTNLVNIIKRTEKGKGHAITFHRRDKGGAEVQLSSFLTLALDGGKLLTP
jgi:hypothetical protein